MMQVFDTYQQATDLKVLRPRHLWRMWSDAGGCSGVAGDFGGCPAATHGRHGSDFVIASVDDLFADGP